MLANWPFPLSALCAHCQLLNDLLGSLEWIFLEGEHGLLSLGRCQLSLLHSSRKAAYVECGKLGAIRVEGFVVVLHELGCASSQQVHGEYCVRGKAY
jgi:hypothetical protein